MPESRSQEQQTVDRESGVQITEDQFFCPRFFCLEAVITQIKNYAHGCPVNSAGRGPTDKLSCGSAMRIQSSSVVLPRHPWVPHVSWGRTYDLPYQREHSA
jgi:hypothetical protein